MPTSDAMNSVQLQAVLRDAVKSATQTGKDLVAVDVAHANAAMQAGMTVVIGPSQVPPANPNQPPTDSLSNPPGSSEKYGSRTSVGVSYAVLVQTPNTNQSELVGYATVTDWAASQVDISANQITAIGKNNADFNALINKAGQNSATKVDGSYRLSDGTTAYWGTWASSSGASALLTLSGSLKQTPELGDRLNYVYATATSSMPSANPLTGPVTFAQRGGGFVNTGGSIQVDFGNKQLSFADLSFTLGTYQFSALKGQASYAGTGAGAFGGYYSAGNCTGCTAFIPTTSKFDGNFVGKDASGVIFSTRMQTGAGTVSGVHLYAR
jgi:hypothetical protein